MIKTSKLIKNLFCKHNYQQIDWRECYDEYRNMMYSERLYKCTKCGKWYWIDGRVDD